MQYSSSPDLSSPPSGSPPATNDQLKPLQEPPALNINHSVHTNPSVASKDPPAAKRRKKDTNGVPKTTATGKDVANNDEKPKRQRAPKGQGARTLAKKAKEEAQRRQAELEASASNFNVGDKAKQAEDYAKQNNGRPAPASVPPGHHYSPPPKNEAIHNLAPQPIHQPFQPQPVTQQTSSYPRPSSGQNYDPVRSSTIPPRRPASPMNHAPVATTPPKVTTPSLNAARSPSISSLIDPPDSFRNYHNANTNNTPKRDNLQTSNFSHDVKRARLSPPPATSTITHPQNRPSNTDVNQNSSSATEEASRVAASGPTQTLSTQSKKPTPTISKGPSPGSHSPKPVARKEAAPLPSTGSGLLTGSMFGATADADDAATEKKAPTVVLDVPLTGGNQYVNFTRLAEQKYGFDALHPRLAAQRERLARVAAAGAALERAKKEGGSGNSADEMSVDLSNDEGDNSNVEMSGMGGSKSGEDAAKPARKKRVLKEDMYDIDDEFIDDTEQAWEEQAAVSMDGFFVYSGPLVPEGEEAKVERYVTSHSFHHAHQLINSRADNAPKRGGRGGGRGGRGGRGSRGGATAANKDSKEPKEVKKRVRRSKEQIERDNRELEEKKLLKQKEKPTLLASKPSANAVPSQMRQQIQFPAQQMTA